MKNSELPIGFTPMPNKRILAAIAAVTLRLINQKNHPWKPADAEREAIRIVSRTLPAAPFRRQLRRPRPSRSDDPAYRKPIPA